MRVCGDAQVPGAEEVSDAAELDRTPRAGRRQRMFPRCASGKAGDRSTLEAVLERIGGDSVTPEVTLSSHEKGRRRA
jgi:hypothetical protein